MKVFIPHYSNEVEKRVLKEKATMEKPVYRRGSLIYDEQMIAYEYHLSSLQTIPMPDMTPEFGKREEVIEGRDFELQWEIYDSGIGRWLKETALTQDPFNNAQRREVAIAIEGKPDRERGVTISTGDTLVNELHIILRSFQWTWDNMGRPHTSDHFNVPANGLKLLEEIIDRLSATPSTTQSVEQPVGEQGAEYWKHRCKLAKQRGK